MLAVESDPFRALVAEAFESARDRATSADPYRSAVSVDLGTGVVAVVADPFPATPRRRVLVIDDETASANVLRSTTDFEVTHVDEGWGAVDVVARTEFDLVLCALRVGEMSAAAVRRMLVNTRPSVGPRFALLASARAADAAPPSSVSHRVLALPITVARVRALLDHE